MDRRAFLTAGAAGAVGWLAGTRTVRGQTPAPAFASGDIPYGQSRLGISDGERDGALYVPKSYKDGELMPLLVMLHGLAGTANSAARTTFPLAEEFGVIVLAPESRRIAWGNGAPGFDPDGVYISDALKYASRNLYVDSAHVGVGGVSDGATYAISMGLAYGELFTHVMVFSEGVPVPYRKEGKPKVFIGHGTEDRQMPIDVTSRRTVPQLQREGYDVTYREYNGGHGMPAPLQREAFEWFTGKPASSK